MNSAFIKSHLMWYLLYQRQYLSCATEYGGHGADGIADVFGITKTGMGHEFEVKVSKQDLMGEINAIRIELNRQETGTLFASSKNIRKYSKHAYYLGREHYLNEWRTKPNHFSFVVPENLVKDAVAGVEGTCYGVLSFDKAGNVFSRRSIGKLHKEPVTEKVLYNFLHKLSTEVDGLRREKLKMLEQVP